MAVEVAVFTFDGIGHITDEDLALDIPYHYTVEAQRTTGIAPRPDDIAIRHVTVHPTEAPEGLSRPGWISFTTRLEFTINEVVTSRPDVQEKLEQAAREAWDSGQVKIASKAPDSR